MKKTLVAAITAAVIMGATGTGFAAGDPFSDVPTGHWAYDAVTTLARDGIIEGYGDGTYRGGQTMTRYEMAEIVANALTKIERANAADKTTINKLAEEYKDELSTIGVRVGKLEKNQPKVNFKGDLRMRYTNTDVKQEGKPSTVAYAYRLRLDATAKIDNATTAGFRFATKELDKDNFSNNTWVTFGENGGGNDNSATIDRVYLKSNWGGDTIATLGRQPLLIDSMGTLMDVGCFSFDGINVKSKVGAVDVTASYGRFIKGVKYGSANTDFTTLFNNLDVLGIGASAKAGKLTYGAGYYKMYNNHAGVDGALNPNGDDTNIQWAIGNLNYNFSNKFSLGLEYAHNGGTDFTSRSANVKNEGNGSDVWTARAIIGDQVLAKRGDQNVMLTYIDAGANSLIPHFRAAIATNNDRASDFKEVTFDYNYAFSSNYKIDLQYCTLRTDSKDARDSGDKDQVRVILLANF